jgi:hypothetical protein
MNQVSSSAPVGAYDESSWMAASGSAISMGPNG